MIGALGDLLLRLYDLAYIERWNDHPKPFHITELDKQAHKAVIAYVIARVEGSEVDWKYLIEGLIFEALQRSVLTDIKPPIFHRLLKEAGERIHSFVLKKVGDSLRSFDKGMYERMESYFREQEERIERRIIRASHFLATYWEFQMIYSVGIRFYGIERIKEAIEDTIEDYFDLRAVERIFLKKKTFNFIDLVGQLRFQKRWIQSPRVPLTTVLGHMFIVACLSYLLSHAGGACTARKYLNFFTGLFHDLPEVTTRDIISPVKRGAGIDDVLKKLEQEQVESVILPLLPESLQREFRYILGYIEEEGVYEEFSNRIFPRGGRSRRVEEIGEDMNRDELRPIDGGLIKLSDVTGAYVEAVLSLYHGIKSRHLKEGVESMRKSLEGRSFGSVEFGKLVDEISGKLEAEFGDGLS